MQNRPPKTNLPRAPFESNQLPPVPGSEALWRRLRIIAGLFALAVSMAMLFGHLSADAIDPLKSTDLKSLKEKLRLNPADEPTKKSIRNLDLQLRARYFRQLSHSSTGVYLLLGGLGLFLLASSRCASYRKQPYIPQRRITPNEPRVTAKIARWSVSAAGASVAAILVVLGLGRGVAIPEPASGDQAASGPAAGAARVEAVSDAELRMNWPRFRGPGGNGISEATNIPVSWDAKTGSGIAWKTPTPAPGFNSPIIWGDRFFFSGGDAAKREVFCYDRVKGQLVWRQPLPTAPAASGKPVEIPETTGYAASSMAPDGRRVYVIFATGDVGAFSFDGKLLWTKAFGPLKNPYGYASSLATWRDRLIVLLDQGEAEDGKSKVCALDGHNGEVVWQTARKVGSSWASPITFDVAGSSQVVALAIPWAISYNLADGSELWRVECLNGEVTPSPTFANGTVLVPSPSEKLLAIQPDGKGDVTKSKVAWSTEENVPDVTSPVSNGELVFTLTTPGLLTCFDFKDGKKLWEHDFEIECHASPTIANGRLYVLGQKGTAIVVETSRQFKELARTDMPDVFHASPAFAPDMIILRGTTNIWGLVKAAK
jgi:outer membrane protein assembly factor BamB